MSLPITYFVGTERDADWKPRLRGVRSGQYAFGSEGVPRSESVGKDARRRRMTSRPVCRWVNALLAVLVSCLGSLGCLAQISFPDGPSPTGKATAPDGNKGAALRKADSPAQATANRPALTTAANPSAPDESSETRETAKTAQEMAIAALIGQDKKPDPAASASSKGAAPTPDAPPRAVPHFPAEPPPLLLASGQAEAKPRVEASAPEAATPIPTPPAALPDGVGPIAEAAPLLPLPNEKQKTTLPAYVIEPPDVLIIDGVRLIPRPPYRVEPLDVLLISVPGAAPGQPIGGPYTVTPDGAVNLGFGYGSFRVAGMTLNQAASAIKAGLRLNNPQVSVALAQFRAIQQVRGEHIVGQDGAISLGSYGCVNVTGLTLSQAKCAIERHLARWLQDPLISVSIGGYNSKVYYVITDGGGFGQQVYRLPITGNETVLDAISLINGLPPAASKRNIWLARPTPAGHGCYEILPVNWEAITEAGSTETNWQIFPGDRVYVKADCWITLDNQLSKVLTPVERLLGATLLGTATVQSFRFNNNGNNGGS